MQINSYGMKYMRLRFSALFAGSVVKMLIMTHEITHGTTVNTFSLMKP